MSDLTQDAKYLMNNEAFTGALESCRSQAMNAALACDVKDDESRRRYLDAVRTVDKVKSHLIALMSATKADEVQPDDFYTTQAKSRFAAFLGK